MFHNNQIRAEVGLSPELESWKGPKIICPLFGNFTYLQCSESGFMYSKFDLITYPTSLLFKITAEVDSTCHI